MQMLKENANMPIGLADSYKSKHISVAATQSESSDASPAAKTVVVGYASEPQNFAEGQLPSREAILYMIYVEKDHDGNKEINWTDTVFKLEVRDYNMSKSASKNKAASARYRLMAPHTSQVKASVTSYCFDSEGVHTKGEGIAETKVLPLPKPLSQSIVPLKQIDALNVEKYKLWVSLQNDRYADKRSITFFNRRPIEAKENVFTLSIQGKYLKKPKSYAVPQDNSLHHAFTQEKEFIARSDPFNISDMVRAVREKIR